jgi:dUTP pyrophosphatase
MQVNIVNTSKHGLPHYQTDGSAGMDLYANLDASIELLPLKRILVPTGVSIALPKGFEAQVRPRSGLAIKQGVTCLNTPGTIDSDYRGEIKVILINLGEETVTIKDGDRIAQLVIAKYEQISWQQVDTLNTTERGDGGFGHTGLTK